MARPVPCLVTCNPFASVQPVAQPVEGFAKNVILTATNKDAIALLLTKIQAGVDVSSVVTAINAL